jgi:DNA processing protein
MLAAGGAIVSPYGEGCDPIAGRFVRRNQVIAALADLVIVIEASTNSGSLHTARFAMALGRKLAVVSGSPGCEALLAAGIAGIESARDVADVLAGRAPVAAVRLPEDGSPPGRVLRALSQRQPVSAEQLQARLGIPLRVLQRVLLRLHLDSLVVALPGQRYLRSPLAARAMASRF